MLTQADRVVNLHETQGEGGISTNYQDKNNTSKHIDIASLSPRGKHRGAFQYPLASFWCGIFDGLSFVGEPLVWRLQQERGKEIYGKNDKGYVLEKEFLEKVFFWAFWLISLLTNAVVFQFRFPV